MGIMFAFVIFAVIIAVLGVGSLVVESEGVCRCARKAARGFSKAVNVLLFIIMLPAWVLWEVSIRL